MRALEQRWRECLGRDSSTEIAEEVFHDLVARYGEKHRAYHTLEHIAACLGHLDTVAPSIENPQGVGLAIWFHDAVYNPRSATNETDSAALASVQLKMLGLDDALIATVRRMILVTKHPSQPQNDDEAHLLDIDLAILGATEQDYEVYERAIRMEYKWVPGFLYRRERSKVLRMFLDQERIYHTNHFHQRFEAQARANLTRALAHLA